MQELIKVTEENGEQRVSARELCEKLGIRERFSVWFERIVKKLLFQVKKRQVNKVLQRKRLRKKL